MIIVTCLLTCFVSIVVSLLLVSFSHNRVEGMAVAKLSGLVMLGLLVPFFIMSGAQYLFSPLPSLWIARLCMEHNYFFALPAVLTSAIWLWLLYGKFNQKLI
jgi:fluoroquinolone transport system permease protein